MKIKLDDIFGQKRLAEKRKEISALTLKLERAEEQVRSLRCERRELEELRKRIENQMEAFAKDHMPVAHGYCRNPHNPTEMRIVFDFEWDYFHRCPDMLRMVGERVIYEALRKCDTWKML